MSLMAYRSRLDERSALVDGYRSSGLVGAVAFWLRNEPAGWRVIAAARDGGVARRHNGVPCDLSRAFSRPLCP
jgi:hypothetical protein